MRDRRPGACHGGGQLITVAQTNIQLYNQLHERGISVEELLLVQRAYELLTTLYPAYYQADGKPFVAHGVGVASILAELDQPAEALAAGLLHNVYGNADFGDGRGPGATPARRRLIREAVGEEIESLVARFPQVRAQWRPLAHTMHTLSRGDESERRLILIDLVDFLEKYVDQGVLYYGRGDRDLVASSRLEDHTLELARALGEPRLVEMLSSAISAARAARGAVPPELRPSPGLRGATQLVPRSCRRRLTVVLRRSAREARRRVRLRTRLRGLRGEARRRLRAAA